MGQQKVGIHIFITSTRKFRVKVTETDGESYEVTVGGQSWNAGKGRKHAARIMKKCEELVSHLSFEYNNIVSQKQ